MFVVVSTYRVRAGEEDAIIALHEDWQRNQSIKASDNFSWELLRNIDAPRQFIAIAHFESKELAQATAYDLERDAWNDRLISLLEEEPERASCRREWQRL